jgi:hypothetical protein
MPLQQVLRTEGQLHTAAMADWHIAVPGTAIPAERYAAEELQRWFARATAIELPIRSGSRPGEKRVFIGEDPLLGEEELRLTINPDSVRVAGGRPRGCLYGAYQFLEEFLGVRFLTWDHTHVPEERPAPIPCGIYRYRPPFSFRWSYYRENADRPDFAARLRVNTVADEERLGGRTPQNLINHSVHALVPFEQYGAAHPEYYALVDGQRDVDTRGGGPQLCVADREVAEISATAAIAQFDAQPGLRNISVSQADTDRYCRCPACEAINQREGTPMGAQLQFVNAVAERVEQVHPRVKVGTLAYWYTRKAPRTMRPRPNVQIQLCSIECCTLHSIDHPDCHKNQAFCQDMREWSAICDDIWIWNYDTNFRSYDLPFPNLRSIGPNVRYFARSHAKGVFMQANGNGRSGEFSDLRNYLIGRLLWDPDADDQALLREFVELHYREAAGPLLAYVDMLHDQAEAQGVHPNCFPTPEEVGLDAQVSRRVLGYFEQALELAVGDDVHARVGKASICAYKAMVATQAWRDEEERVALVARYIALCRRHEMTHTAEHQEAEEYFAQL